MIASYEGDQYQEYEYPFYVEVGDPCENAVLSIDPTIIPSTIIYSIGQFVKSIAFDERRVFSSVKDCPNVAFALEYQDGEVIDPEIFTQYSQMLKIYSVDVTKIGTYSMRLIVYFDSNSVTYDNTAQLDFTVEIESGTGDLATSELIVSNYYLDAQGVLSLEFNYPLAVPKKYQDL